ncbi:hypothetical protein SATRM34S_01611 [Streptomyces atroolivaceus]
MQGALPPHPVKRSPEGDGFTVCPDAHGPLRVTGDVAGHVRGMADEVPDEPLHLSLGADRVLRRGREAEVAAPEKPHVMPCGRGRTGQTPFCDHSGTGAVHHRRGPEPADRPTRGAPDG